MALPPATFTQNSHFEDKIVDNNGFFQAIEDEMPSLLSIAEVRAQTRLEIQKLFAHMKQQTFIQGVTEWTAGEQENFFKKVESEIIDAGMMASSIMREKIQALVEDEIWREINDEGKKYSLQDGAGHTLIADVGEYQNFLDTSFLLAKETTLIPLDLRLTVNQTETIQDAEKKLNRYHGKYNALILVDDANNPIGVIRARTIEQYKQSGHTRLEGIQILYSVFGYYATSNAELRDVMQAHDINVLPIIDSKTGVLIGILTNNSLLKKEVQYYSATSITRLSLEVGMKDITSQEV